MSKEKNVGSEAPNPPQKQQVMEFTPEKLMEGGIMPVAVVSQMPYRTPQNAKVRKAITEFEVNTQPSETVPDQSLTVSELIYRFTHGKVTERVAVYDTDVPFEMPHNWKSLDLSEQMEWLENKRVEYADITDRIQKEKDLMIQREREAEIDKRVAEKMEANRIAKERERVQSVLFKENP